MVPENVTLPHALIFVYITLAHITDGELADSERDAILLKVNEWIPDESLSTTRSIMDEVINWYNSLNADETLQTMASLLGVAKENLSRDNLIAMYNDCIDIANADGNSLETEAKFLELMKETLGL